MLQESAAYLGSAARTGSEWGGERKGVIEDTCVFSTLIGKKSAFSTRTPNKSL